MRDEEQGSKVQNGGIAVGMLFLQRDCRF